MRIRMQIQGKKEEDKDTGTVDTSNFIDTVGIMLIKK